MAEPAPLPRYLAKGVLPILAASVLWAGSFFIRKSITHHLGPLTITTIASFSGALVVMAGFGIDRARITRALRDHGAGIVLLSILSVSVGSTLMVVGLKNVDLGLAATIEKTQSIWAVLLALAFAGERASPAALAVAGTGIAGALALARLGYADGGRTAAELLGTVAIFGTALAWAAAGVIGRKLLLNDIGSANLAFLRGVIGGIVILPLALVFEIGDPAYDMDRFSLLLAVVVGVFGGGIAHAVYYAGVKYVSGTVAGVLEFATPTIAAVLGVALLGERIAPAEILAGLVLFGSVFVLMLRRRGHG